MTTKTKRILTISLTALAITAFVITPHAWFAYYWTFGNPAFKPGYNTVMPDVTMWMYNAGDDISDSGSISVEGWHEIPKRGENDNYGIVIDDPNVTIPKIEQETGDKVTKAIKYKYESLHFGKVDNLIALRDDNKIYLRFKFNTAEHGSNVLKLNLSYATSGYSYTGKSVLDSIHLYDLNMSAKDEAGNTNNPVIDLKTPITIEGKESTGERHTIEFDPTRPGAMQFVQYRYVISTNGDLSPIAYTDDGAVSPEMNENFAKLFEDAIAVPISCGRADGKCDNDCNCSKRVSATETEAPAQGCAVCEEAGRCSECTSCTGCSKNKCGSVVIDNPTKGLVKENETYEGDYYLYIELAPLLDAFGMQENILDYFVPSYMLFDVNFDIEIG